MDAAKRRTRLMDLARLGAIEDMQEQWAEQQRNREAESAKVRRDVWGEEPTMPSEEEMRQTVLGDINYMQPAPPQQPQQPQSNMPAIALAALLSTLGGGLAGYYFSSKNQPEVPAFDDESVRLGLGRIEDYLTKGE